MEDRASSERGYITCRFTTLSKASLLSMSADTCFAMCSHQAGEEKRCSRATLQRSRRTAGTTVGSVPRSDHEMTYGSANKEIVDPTLGTDHNTHGLMPLLAYERQQLLRQAASDSVRRQVLQWWFVRSSRYALEHVRRIWEGLTLCASSTTSTFPVSTLARTNNLVIISKSPHADVGSMKGSERSMIVSWPAANREGAARCSPRGRLSRKASSSAVRCSKPASCAGLNFFFRSWSSSLKP